MIVRTRVGVVLSWLLVITEGVLELIPEQSDAYSEGDHIQMRCSYPIVGESQSLEIRFVKETVGLNHSQAHVIQSTKSRVDKEEEVLILEATSEQELKAADHGATIYCDLIRHDQIVTREAKVINVTAPPEVVRSLRVGKHAQQLLLQVLSNPPIDKVDLFEINEDKEEEPSEEYDVSLETINGAFVNVEINSTGNPERRLAVYVNNRLGKTKFVFPDDNQEEAVDSHRSDLPIEEPVTDDLSSEVTDGQESTSAPTTSQKTSISSKFPGGPSATYLAPLDKAMTMDCWANDEADSIVWKTPSGELLTCTFEGCSDACKPFSDDCGYRLVHFNDNPSSFALVIDSVGFMDYGEWECREKQTSMALFKATVFPDKPKLLIVNEEGQGFTSGQTIRYSCSYESVVQVKLRWDHVGELQHHGRSARELHNIQSLYSLDTKDDDFGTYVTCEAEFPRIWNVTGRAIASKRVQIKVIPKLWPAEDNIIMFLAEYRAIVKVMAYPFPREENIFAMAGNMSVESWKPPNITKHTEHTGEIEMFFPRVSREWKVIIKNSVGQQEVTLNFKPISNKGMISTWWFWVALLGLLALVTLGIFAVYRFTRARHRRSAPRGQNSLYNRYSDYRYQEPN